MTNQTLIHIGASKTATSTLQRNVFMCIPEIIFLGKPFSNERGHAIDTAEIDLLRRVVIEIERSPADRSLEESLGATLSIVQRLGASKSARIVLSDERFCNNKYVPHDVIAKRLRAAFGPADIMLTIRNQFSALPSLYLQELRTSMNLTTFSDWLDGVLADPTAQNRQGESIAQYRYNSLIENFGSAFADVTVFLYEDLVVEQEKYAQRLAQFIGANPAKVEVLLSDPRKNEAKSAAWYRYRNRYTRIKAVLPFRLVKSLPGVGWVEQSIKRYFEGEAALDAPMKIVLSPQDRKHIEDFFGADNRALVKRLGIDLGLRSYPGCN